MRPGSAVALDWWRPPVAEPATASAAGTPESARLDAPASGLAYGAFVAFTCVLLLAPQNFLPILGRLRIAMLLGTIAIVTHVRDRWAQGLPVTRPSREMTAALALLAWTIFGLPFSLWPGGSLALLLDLYVKALAVFWLMGNLVDTLPRLRGMALALTLLTVALALVGVSNYVTGVFSATQDRRILGYDAGLTRNPNDLALMLNLVIPMTLALLLSAASTLRRAAFGLALVVQVTGVVLTFSRTGFLTLLTTCGLFGLRLLRRPSRGLVLAGALAALLALPFVPSGYVDRLLTLSAVDADPTGSAQARWGGIVAALEHAVEHPVMGAGLGMNILVLNESVGATWRAVHNTYLEYAVDLGLPGLALFALVLHGSWKAARRARRHAGAELAQLAEGVEISLVGFAVAAFFHPAAYEFYFFYVAGLALAARTAFARQGAAV